MGAPTPDPSAKREGSVRFAGYAAVFDRPDRGGDVVRRGAFAGARESVPLLWQHRGCPVGAVRVLGEDDRGLRVMGEVRQPELAALVAAGAVAGLSFGYRVRAGRWGTYRELTDVELVEVSLVATPMQALARVHRVERGELPLHHSAAPNGPPPWASSGRNPNLEGECA